MEKLKCYARFQYVNHDNRLLSMNRQMCSSMHKQSDGDLHKHSKLDYPSLPRIVDIIEKENVIYVVMDYIEGETLSSVLQQ